MSADSDRVSRQTPADTLLSSLFGDRDEVIKRYVDLLATDAVTRGLIGPREVPRLWDRHIINCAVIEPAFGANTTVADIGSGAGLPGVVLAIARPDLQVAVVEPLLRRASFLGEAVAALGLDNVEVIRARAEQLHGGRRFDSVTSRALAPLDRLLGWCWPLVGGGGQVAAIKGARANDELAEHADSIARLRPAGRAEVATYGENLVAQATIVVRIQSCRASTEG
ncbi:MAG: 16S rRNA (guanine(527)-N(7))-methyltransferase RsmG [Nocardioidaceae bacterium]|nr:16S rRNA (guanine(527)-N(7))-methyltransferase RsmG [Nocardioidaceae bacterium]